MLPCPETLEESILNDHEECEVDKQEGEKSGETGGGGGKVGVGEEVEGVEGEENVERRLQEGERG